jgi:hypothetical protein
MITHTCKYCNYNTHYKNSYDRHCKSQKHKNNSINKNTDNSNNTENKIMFDTMMKEIEKLKAINNQNTNKIVKEARSIKKSILTILNTNFKDTPPIDYIDEKEFRKELEKEYQRKINDKDSQLFMRIFSDFEKNKLEKTLGDLILKFVKKEDQLEQSVFNIDSSRGNYATKIEDYWLNDKKGLQLKKYTLDMVVGYMINVMDVFRERLADMCEENKKERNSSVTEYVLKHRGLLLDVNAYLTNSNAHKKIILYMCPELRIDDKVLLAITEK